MKIALASAKFIEKNVGYNLSQIIRFAYALNFPMGKLFLPFPWAKRIF